jgi:hypothetical protein
MRRPFFLLFVALAGASAPSFASRIEIASEEDTLLDWERANRVPPPAWPELAGGVDRACINLAYLIDRKGGTSAPILLRAWAPGLPEGPRTNEQLASFTQSAAATLAQWRFRPAAANSRQRPLITNVVFLFARSAETDLAQLRQSCLVGDLRDFMYRKAEDGQRRGNLNQWLIERTRQEFPSTIPEGCARHAGWCD